MPDEQKTPLPPPFKREDVDPITHAKLQEARGRVIDEAMRRNHAVAVSRMAQAEEREAHRVARERLGRVKQYEAKKDRAGMEFEGRRQKSIRRAVQLDSLGVPASRTNSFEKNR